MIKPVVIVDPRSSGIELAPTFKANGIPAIAVTLEHLQKESKFSLKIEPGDFLQVIPNQPDLAEILRTFDPLAIIPGTDDAVSLADELTHKLTPHFANDPKKALHRRHKALMQKALEETGVASLKTISTDSEDSVCAWIKDNKFDGSPLIVKPPISAGSQNVFHIAPRGNWRRCFREILGEPSFTTGKTNETVVVQQRAEGVEFAVGTVSAQGKHSIVHLIRYHKIPFNGRETIYDHVEFVSMQSEIAAEIFEYTTRVLDALGIRWGAAHTEIMMTPKGPRLIETGARMCGGPTVTFARKATGSSQADRLVEAYVYGHVSTPQFNFKTTVVPVFLKASRNGILNNIEVLNECATLPTFFQQFIWYKNGDHVPKTVDYLTNLGIVALTGERHMIFEDYKKIREIESKLHIS